MFRWLRDTADAALSRNSVLGTRTLVAVTSL